MSSTDASNTIATTRLTDEQQETLRRVNENMDAILREFDAVLARHGIQRQVFDFSMAPVRTGGCQMCCCTNPPPSEACCNKCPKPIAAPPSRPPLA